MENQKHIVITSIFEPSDSIVAFSKMNDYRLIVVGDKKTPKKWACENVEFISVSEQEKLDYNILQYIPYNHYSRKMIGYLRAIEERAEYIIETDDDNLPKDNWGFPQFTGEFDCLDSDMGFINIYQLFTSQKVWPRGLPLRLINKDVEIEEHIKEKSCKIGIWQGLADEDPDVDAIYRLTIDEPCFFNKRFPVVLSEKTICPFNTQNTITRKELFPLLYLPCFVTFRFTDILRGLIAQPIMWLYNYQLGFIEATVTQKRNPHDYMKDFISEIPMYQYCERVVELVTQSIRASHNIKDNLYNAYNSIEKEGIICDKEMKTLEAWLNDLTTLHI